MKPGQLKLEWRGKPGGGRIGRPLLSKGKDLLCSQKGSLMRILGSLREGIEPPNINVTIFELPIADNLVLRMFGEC